MSILDNLTESRTDQYRCSDFRAPALLEMDCKGTDNYRPQVLDRNEEFELRATVGVRFWANKAQYRDARKTAERVLLDRMYGETLALLNEARKAVFDGDATATLAVLDQIKSNLMERSR